MADNKKSTSKKTKAVAKKAPAKKAPAKKKQTTKKTTTVVKSSSGVAPIAPKATEKPRKGLFSFLKRG